MKKGWMVLLFVIVILSAGTTEELHDVEELYKEILEQSTWWRGYPNHVIPEIQIARWSRLTNQLQGLRAEYFKSSTSEDFTDLKEHFRSESKALPIQRLIEAIRKDRNISATCKLHTLAYLRAVDGMDEEWALRMLDATAKWESGILEGNSAWIGAFSECLDVDVNLDRPIDDLLEERKFKGQHCMLQLKPKQDLKSLVLVSFGLTFAFGVCLPSTCSSNDVHFIAEDFLSLLNVSVTAIAEAQYCHYKGNEEELDAPAIAMIAVCGVFAALLILATLCDVWVQCRQKDDETEHRLSVSQRIILSFSVYTNGKKLLNTDQNEDMLGCLNGIRFLSITWVMMGHCFSAGLQFGLQNGVKVLDYMKQFTFQVILNATPSVDSFFFLSGFLVAYVFFKEMTRSPRSFNIGMFYFHRFWRLTPLYMMVLGISTALFRYLGHGPMYNVAPLFTTCQKYWWRNLLYIQNMFPTSDNGGALGCQPVAWYLANDMQFYLLSPLILIPLYKKPKVGYIITAAFMIITTVTPWVLASNMNYVAAGTNLVSTDNKYQDDIYVKPWCRMGPYLVGIILAYILHRTGRNLRIGQVWVVLGWCLAAAMNISVIYGLYPYNHGDETMSVSLSAAYVALSRTAWSVGLAWVVFACVTGHGGFVNELLSWKVFIPLGRLTYSVYLIHLFVVVYFYATRETTWSVDYIYVVFIYLAVLVVSNAIGFVASLAFEAPMIQLEKILLRPARNPLGRVPANRSDGGVSLIGHREDNERGHAINDGSGYP